MDKWEKCVLDEVNPLDIKGAKVKAFKTKNNKIVTLGDKNKAFKFAVVVYDVDGQNLVELKYAADCVTPWRNAPANLVKSLVEIRGMNPDEQVKEVNGRFLVSGLNLSHVVDIYWREVCYMFLYPDTIKSVKDAHEVFVAAYGLQSGMWKMRDDSFGKSLEKHRQKLVEAKQALADYEMEYDEICAKAAEAMNELSERFGIEVDMQRS